MASESNDIRRLRQQVIRDLAGLSRPWRPRTLTRRQRLQRTIRRFWRSHRR